MHKSILVFTAAVMCVPLSGCGGCGSPSAAQMRKYAQRRSAPEVEPPKTAAPSEQSKSGGSVKAGSPPMPPPAAAAPAVAATVEVKPE
ncbi:MAG TPA: hypothetical protein VFB80_21870, partial [Pirellulaceae bacterium]|nr:hypothetical protein [Pirellulaceae bacterium]